MSISENTLNKTEKSQEVNIILFALLYIMIAFFFLAIGPRVFSSEWVSSSDFHACIEISSSFIAIIAAIACLIYYFGLKNRYFLIIGLGFFICGSEDFIHGILGFSRLFGTTDPVFIKLSEFTPDYVAEVNGHDLVWVYNIYNKYQNMFSNAPNEA